MSRVEMALFAVAAGAKLKLFAPRTRPPPVTVLVLVPVVPADVRVARVAVLPPRFNAPPVLVKATAGAAPRVAAAAPNWSVPPAMVVVPV